MAKTKKMSYKDMKEMLKNFDSMSNSRKGALAKLNKCTVDEMKQKLELCCYRIDNLGINAVKALRKDINNMSDEEIAVVERVNNMTITEIISTLDNQILEDKKYREFCKAWKIRKKEVDIEMINKGIINLDGNIVCGFLDGIQRTYYEEQVALAKEMGVHIHIYDAYLMEHFES